MAEEPNPRDILFRRRTLVLTGEINDNSISEIRKDLLVLQAESLEPIHLLIDSGGGENDAALDLCDFITYVMTAPVHGIVIGDCMSAATFVLLHCAKRVSTPYARFLIHSSVRGGITITLNDRTSTDLEHLLKLSKATTELMIQMYMQKLNKSREEVLALIERGEQRFDKTISAEEAVQIGLIEEIVTSKLGIFPNPSE